MQTIATAAVRHNRTPGPPLAQYASVAHVARVYDYLLGGKDNVAADREAAEQAMLINPSVVPTARANRAFWPVPSAT